MQRLRYHEFLWLWCRSLCLEYLTLEMPERHFLLNIISILHTITGAI